MATKYWLGGSGTADEGKINVAANWSPAGVPGAGDDVIFDGRSAVNVAGDLATFASVDLGSLIARAAFTGNIGTYAVGVSHDPLIMQCSSGSVYIAGPGVARIQCGAGAEQDATIALLVINTSGSVYLSSRANDETNVAAFTEVQALRGNVIIHGDSQKGGAAGHGGDSGTAIGTLKVLPYGTATILIGDKCQNFKGADVPMNLVVSGGTVTCHTSLTTVEQYGGTLNHGSTLMDMVGDDDDIASLMLVGGTFVWQPQTSGSISASPSIGTLKVISGTFNGANMLETLSVDPAIDLVYQYYGTVDLRNIYANFDIGNYSWEGGTLLFSPGQELSFEGGA